MILCVVFVLTHDQSIKNGPSISSVNSTKMSNDSNSWWDWTYRMLMKYSKETTYIGYFPARVGHRFKSAAPNNAEVQVAVLCITV